MNFRTGGANLPVCRDDQQGAAHRFGNSFWQPFYEFDLALAGHSHGGQVRLPFYGPLVVPFGVGRYNLGLFRTVAGPLYVGAGFGWFYLNVRFNGRPEITVIGI